MAISQQLQPLPQNTPIVDPDTGMPTIAFQRWWQQVTGNSDFLDGEVGTKADKTVTVTGVGDLGGGGDLSANREITHDDSGVTAGSYTNANITVNDRGHVTVASNGTSGAGYFNGYTGVEGGVDSAAYATKGHLYTPSVDVEIDSLYFIIDSNGVYQCQIAEVNTTTGEVLSIAGTSSTVASIGITWWNKLSFATPAPLTAGTNYAILLIRTGGAGTDTCSLTSTQNGFMNAPGAIRHEANKLLKYNTVGVTVTQTASVVAAGSGYNLAIEGRLV